VNVKERLLGGEIVECEGGKREGDRDEYDQSILYACLK
jgi:hypothetical protein